MIEGFVRIEARKNRCRMATMGIFTTEYREVTRRLKAMADDFRNNPEIGRYESVRFVTAKSLRHELDGDCIMDDKSLRAKRRLENVAGLPNPGRPS